MVLKKFPELKKFLSTILFDADPEFDVKNTQEYAKTISFDTRDSLSRTLKELSTPGALSLDELGSEANRWFSSEDEARTWLNLLAETLEQDMELAQGLRAKDSNGAELLEGDSVLVIKDLKVKGGSSDLKRGTLIKKIHLTSDPGLIECRVDGSTLVLKTEFLKRN
jgi:protein PhnA